MQIRTITQSQPNFGMAFLKPDDMEAFTKYVTHNRKASVVKRGIEQLRREQKNNKHFDIKYLDSDEIMLCPKTKDAEAVATALIYNKEVGGRLTKVQTISKSINKDLDSAEKSGSKMKSFAAMAKGLFKAIKLQVIKKLNPKYSLPKNLVLAADDATALEKAAEQRIKRHALIEQAFKD